MKKLIPALLILFTFTSCVSNRIYFTVDTKKQLSEADIDLKKVQFYNSEEIVLIRQATEAEMNVEDGKVKMKNGKYIEEIIIPAGTPGICEVFDEKSLRVSFDDGEGNALPFLVERKGGVVVDRSGFKIAAKNWKRTSNGRQIGKVDYEKQMFTLIKGANSKLLIDKTTLTKVDRTTKVAKGRKL